MGTRHLARQAERQLERHGDGESLFFEDRWYTRGWLADQAARFGAGLAGLGVRPGDRVVVLMANCPEVLVTYTAAWRAGAVVTPLIFLVSEDELRHALADSGAVAVVTTPEFLPKVQAAAHGVDSVRLIIVAGEASATGGAAGTGAGPRVLSFAEVAAAAPGTIVDRADDDLAALLYTGGTTGRSKGVPLTHANLFWCGSSSHQSSSTDTLTSTLMPLPLAHAYGLLVTCVGMHAEVPGRSILMRWFDPAGWLKLAQQHRAQRTTLVPSMIQMLLAQPLAEADLSALVAVSSGAAPLAAEVREEFERLVPSATVYEGYGCTESASIIASNPLGARRLGSVGLPVPGCTVQIRDDAGQVLGPGQDGEICVHSPGVLSGYWHAPDATATALRDGWLYTGDIGHLDADGYLYVVDRKKDLIIRGGFNVYPRDIEDVLLAHPAVAQAAAVGRPDPRLGEEVVAFVALRPDATATPDELVEHTKAQLAATKYPREVRIVPAIPLTSVGKLDRKRLRTQVREEGADATGG
ncbi:MAG TPA: AMP-binding protein [Streptosporangiaceae bacterium]|nr:AMP-binding protein [Streptosporangiaceae bacterium]